MKRMDNYNFPIGADNSDAPWNEIELPVIDTEVTVSITISKTIKVPVVDYTLDEEGYPDLSNCDLKQAVSNSGKLPNLKDWNIDEFEIIQE